MTSDLNIKLNEMGIDLDKPAMPAGDYVPVLVIEDMILSLIHI